MAAQGQAMTLEDRLAAHLEGTWTPYVGKPEQMLDRDKAMARKARNPGLTPRQIRTLMEKPKPVPEPIPEEEKTVVPVDREPTLHEILKIVSEETGVKMMCLMSHRRQAPTVRARMMYFHAARECTSKSFPQIAKHCGDRDHTTVLHGIGKIRDKPDMFEPELGRILSRIHYVILPDNPSQ